MSLSIVVAIKLIAILIFVLPSPLSPSIFPYTTLFRSALDLIEVDYEPTQAVSDPEKAIAPGAPAIAFSGSETRSEEHTSELQSRGQLVCRLLVGKIKQNSRCGP